MPSEYALRGTAWNASDFGGAPPPSEFTYECHECDAETAGDEMDGWDTTTCTETYETTILCPECYDAE